MSKDVVAHKKIPLRLIDPSDLARPLDRNAYSAWLQERRYTVERLTHCTDANGERIIQVPSTVYDPDSADRHADEMVADEALRLSAREEAEAAGFALARSRHSGRVVYTREGATLSPVPAGWTINSNGAVLARGKTVAETLKAFPVCHNDPV